MQKKCDKNLCGSDQSGGDMKMDYPENKVKYNLEYAKKNLKRIPLDVQKEKYEEIKAAAECAGETVKGYIKKAIDERMQRERG